MQLIIVILDKVATSMNNYINVIEIKISKAISQKSEE
jgi:hypothetical protein